MINEKTELSLDGTTPAAAGMLVEKQHELILQQGGYASLMPYDHVEFMDLEHFMQYEVPKLRDELKTGESLRILRSLNNDYMLVMFRDSVIKYHLTDMVEVPMKVFAEKLKDNNNEIRLVFDIPYRLVSYIKQPKQYSVIVYIPSQRVVYNTELGWKKIAFPVYMPPVWFKVDMSLAYHVLEAGVAVALNQASDITKTELRHWPLPNVFPGGSICFGSSTLQSEQGVTPSMGIAVKRIVDQFFNSNWNLDLLDPAIQCIEELGQLYEKLPKIKELEDILPNLIESRPNYVLYVLRLFADPMGYMRYPWSHREPLDTVKFMKPFNEAGGRF